MLEIIIEKEIVAYKYYIDKILLPHLKVQPKDYWLWYAHGEGLHFKSVVIHKIEKATH